MNRSNCPSVEIHMVCLSKFGQKNQRRERVEMIVERAAPSGHLKR